MKVVLLLMMCITIFIASIVISPLFNTSVIITCIMAVSHFHILVNFSYVDLPVIIDIKSIVIHKLHDN